MNRDPKSGDLYVFRNKRGDLLKALFYDHHGYCVLAKRLERKSFRVSLDDAQSMQNEVEISSADLAQLLTQLTLRRTRDEIMA